MNKVFIVAAKRSAIGKFLGSLTNVAPADLAAVVLKDIISETKINPADLDEVIVGNILMAGQGQGVARQASIKAGIPVEVPAYGVNMICGSGMKTIINGYNAIATGDAKPNYRWRNRVDVWSSLRASRNYPQRTKDDGFQGC